MIQPVELRRPAPGRFDAIVAAVVSGLESYRRMIEDEAPLNNITVVVPFDRRTGRPRPVIVRTESQRGA